MILVEVAVEAGGWEALGDAEAIAGRAVKAALQAAGEAGPALVSLAFDDDAGVRALNRAWRGQDQPTNVLSFPAPPLPAGAGPRLLGDIALAFETVAREAAAEGKPLADHAAHLIVHGALHLLGYDHQIEAEAESMEALEVEALALIGIADPYRGLAA